MAPVNYNLNQIVGALTTSWNGSGYGQTRTWSGTSVTYSMPNTSPNRSDTEDDGFRQMTLTEKTYATMAFELWDDLIAIDLNPVDSTDAQITVGFSSTTNGGGTYASPYLVAQPPGSSTFDREIERERIWFNTGWTEFQDGNYRYGERGLETMIHEIGHSLGLSHPGPYNAGDGSTYAANALYTQDTLQWTIMSYWAAGSDGTTVDRTGGGRTIDPVGDGVNATTPLLHDIMAIQAKYGADMTTRTGDDTYGFNVRLSGTWRPIYDFSWYVNPDPVLAIWDAGGVDTLDVSGYTENQRIDLNPGTISDVGALTQNVAIAYGAIIENAVGGAGNDSITGNGVANRLTGNDGDDQIWGNDGNDWLQGGRGTDRLDGGAGFDTASYADAANGVTIDMRVPVGESQGKIVAGAWGNDTVIGIEAFEGSNYDDNFYGNTGRDWFYGLGGNDTMNGGGGGDWLDGGAGFDTVVFTTAATVNLANGVHGGSAAGSSFISIEKFVGSSDADTFIAGAAGVYFAGGDGDDRLYGGAGSDWLQGGRGNDILNGGGGFDTVSYADAPNAISIDLRLKSDTSQGKVVGGEWGGDTLVDIEAFEGSAQGDTFYGDDALNWFYGLAGDDTFDGGGGADRIFGGDGNDTIAVGIGDVIDGGAGFDTATFAAAVTINLANGVHGGAAAGATLLNMERFIGSAAADTMVARDGAASWFIGGDGEDQLYGANGNDFLQGGKGNDYINGGAGFDTASYADAGGAVTVDLSTVYGEAQGKVVGGEWGGDTLVGIEAIEGSAFNDILVGSAGGDTFYGLAGDDRLEGRDGFDRLEGGDGNDQLDGGAGFDTLIGGAGDDTYVVDAGDVVSENANEGIDTVLTALNSNALLTHFENLTFTGSGAFVGTGNASANILRGGAGNDVLAGLGGDDTLVGGLGNDVMDGGAGFDTADFSDHSGAILAVLAGAANSAVRVDGVARDVIRNIENLIGGSGNDILTGDALANTLIGGDGDDSLRGGGGLDLIDGGAGSDTADFRDKTAAISLRLRGANDTQAIIGGVAEDTLRNLENVLGGRGDDVLIGDNTANLFRGGLGADILNGSGGFDTADYSDKTTAVVVTLNEGTDAIVTVGGVAEDTLRFIENLIGGSAADRLTGDRLANVLAGGAGNDRLEGAAGNDTLDGGAGFDAMLGGLGDDTYVVDSAGDTITEAAGEGTDTVRTALTSLTLANNVENLVYTGSGNFRGTGNALANVIDGGAGNDRLDGGAGSDLLRGGAGNDIYLVDVTSDRIVEAADGGTDTVFTTLAAYTLADNLEDLIYSGAGAFTGIGNAAANRITGAGGNDRLYGFAGADTLTGNGGDDLLDGGADADVMTGGAGNDTYVVDHVQDRISEGRGQGTDTVRTSLSTFTLGDNFENLIFIGAGAFTGIGNALANAITGGVGDDRLFGNAGDDTLNGGNGNDALDGGSGNDTLIGGAGNDSYTVDSAGDVVLEGTGRGTDTVFTTLSAYTLGDNVENLDFDGVGPFAGTGNGLANSITGGTGNDVLDGRGGADTLIGGAGNDTYLVDRSDDVIVEGRARGTDTVHATAAAYTLGDYVENLIYTGPGAFAGTGNELFNTLVGGLGNDTLDGASGNDTLEGGGRADLLTGGLGADAFVYRAFSDSSASRFDTIMDFSAAERDRIDLSAIDANTLGGGDDDAFVYINSALFSGIAGELRFANGVLQADGNGDRIADLTIRLAGITTLAAGSVVL